MAIDQAYKRDKSLILIFSRRKIHVIELVGKVINRGVLIMNESHNNL